MNQIAQCVTKTVYIPVRSQLSAAIHPIFVFYKLLFVIAFDAFSIRWRRFSSFYFSFIPFLCCHYVKTMRFKAICLVIHHSPFLLDSHIFPELTASGLLLGLDIFMRYAVLIRNGNESEPKCMHIYNEEISFVCHVIPSHPMGALTISQRCCKYFAICRSNTSNIEHWTSDSLD